MTASSLQAPVRLLGVDGGGTSTEAWLAEPGGRVLGRGKAGPSNAKAVGLPAARQALDAAIRAAFDDAQVTPAPVDVACLGLAGFDRPDDRRLLAGWAEEAHWATRLVLANDGDLVVAAGTPEGWGIGVIAGTGSIAVGRTADGRTARAGGWGHLIGDEGSAYAVVLDALRLVARRADGREPRPRDGRDPLTARLCAALGADANVSNHHHNLRVRALTVPALPRWPPRSLRPVPNVRKRPGGCLCPRAKRSPRWSLPWPVRSTGNRAGFPWPRPAGFFSLPGPSSRR